MPRELDNNMREHLRRALADFSSTTRLTQEALNQLNELIQTYSATSVTLTFQPSSQIDEIILPAVPAFPQTDEYTYTPRIEAFPGGMIENHNVNDPRLQMVAELREEGLSDAEIDAWLSGRSRRQLPPSAELHPLFIDEVDHTRSMTTMPNRPREDPRNTVIPFMATTPWYREMAFPERSAAPLSALQQAVNASPHTQPRMAGAAEQQLVEQGYTGEIPEHFICPISQEIMTDPVYITGFHNTQRFERAHLLYWFKKQNYMTHPITRESITQANELHADENMRAQIEIFIRNPDAYLQMKKVMREVVESPSLLMYRSMNSVMNELVAETAHIRAQL